MSGDWQTQEPLTVQNLQHVVAVGARNVGSIKLRQAAALLAMGSAADVREDATKLGRVLDGLLRHVALPENMSAFEAFMLAMFARRHASHVPDLKRLAWLDAVDEATNPKFENWSYRRAVEITHSHAMLTQFDEYCIEGKKLCEAMPDVSLVMRSLVTAQRFRSPEVLRMLTHKKMYLTTWSELGAVGEMCETSHKNMPSAMYPGRRLWPDGSLSVGATGETKRCSIGEACTTMRSQSFCPSTYMEAKPVEKRLMLEQIVGIGELNRSHLSRVLDHATNCGLAQSDSLGSNAKIAIEVIGHSLQNVKDRTLPWLRKMGITTHLSLEELQMDLCIVMYSLQTFIAGTNSHHPRLSLGTSVKAKRVPLMPCKKKKNISATDTVSQQTGAVVASAPKLPSVRKITMKQKRGGA